MTTIKNEDSLKTYDVFMLSVDWMEGGKVSVQPVTIQETEKGFQEGLKDGLYFKTFEEADNKIKKQFE